MKHLRTVAAVLCAAALQAVPAMAQPAPKVEYIDIRWDGIDRMCVVFPDGRVQFVAAELKGFSRPDDADRRAFYMTIEMNRMAAQGYEFAGMISDEIIMKRTISR
jgi:hypothetical protein